MAPDMAPHGPLRDSPNPANVARLPTDGYTPLLGKVPGRWGVLADADVGTRFPQAEVSACVDGPALAAYQDAAGDHWRALDPDGRDVDGRAKPGPKRPTGNTPAGRRPAELNAVGVDPKAQVRT